MTEHPKSAPFKGNGIAGFLRSPAGVAVCIVLAGVGLALVFEHWVHLLAGVSLLLPLAICLLMHFFMHRGHGGGHGDRRRGQSTPVCVPSRRNQSRSSRR